MYLGDDLLLDLRRPLLVVEDESAFREQFWRKTRRVAASIPFAEDLLAAYYCAFDHNTPLPVKTALIGALAYFLLPADVIPDVLPVLGFTDGYASAYGAAVQNELTPVSVH